MPRPGSSWTQSQSQCPGLPVVSVASVCGYRRPRPGPEGSLVIRSSLLGPRSNWRGAAAAAKSRQSCPTRCDSIDGSPPGSPIPGILHIEKSLRCQATGHFRQEVQSTLCIPHPGRAHEVPAASPQALMVFLFPWGWLLLPVKQASITGHPTHDACFPRAAPEPLQA